MQTAKEFLDNFIGKCYFDKSINSYYTEAMIEFAKLHVKEALKKAEKNLYTKEDVLKAGEIGEINHFDYKHIVSLLDEAKAINKLLKKNKKY